MGWLDLLQRRWVWVVVGYIILLLASTAVRWSRAEKPLPADTKSVPVFAVKGDQKLENKSVKFAYREYAPEGANTTNAPIFLVHGSPGDSEGLSDLARELSRGGRHVIVPDLPGFGASTENIPDYSFRAHAVYLLQLADELKIERFHALGFSMGGGVVLNAYDIAPNRLASIEMISAIGVQEYELLGDYYFNHILHGAQLAALLAVRELAPHFGYFDGAFFGTSYARNFYDSDQRPLRGILSRIETPVLIVHGAKDSLVPVAAAREHYRLVPQSEYFEIADIHFMVFQRPEAVAPLVEDFLKKVETGAARTRFDADGERIKRAAAPFEQEMLMADGSTAVVFFLAIILATFISEDLTCLTAGALAGHGRISIALAIAACVCGIFLGDVLIYLAGRFFGTRFLRRAPLRWFVSENAVQRGANWLERNGAIAVFTSRFTPGLRLPLYFAAGSVRANFAKFGVFFLIAAFVWTPLLVGTTAYFSSGMMELPMLDKNFYLGIAAVVAAAFVLLNLGLRLVTWRGRRLLVGAFKRWTEWEFWSLRTFYFPVVLYVLWLSVKFRSLSVFADANPAIEAGGFVGESKREIYEGLRKSEASAAHFLTYVFVPARLELAEKLNAVERFMTENDLEFPVALKPNAGERGAGVFLVKTRDELRQRIEAATDATDFIVQELATGDEFSVFYYRYPNEEKGRIFSITEKRFPFVTGDGRATLETLILRDRRAVALANSYFERNAERLDTVPQKGEQVSIIDIGTHSKGAIFLDGGWAQTEELEAEIDRVCRGYEGFYFGRFDLRTASAEDFKKGDFKIIELNGVTSEATSIYDPKNSLIEAYRILFRQWRIAFEIGAQNRARGAAQTTVGQLVKLILGKKHESRRAQAETRNMKPEIEECV